MYLQTDFRYNPLLARSQARCFRIICPAGIFIDIAFLWCELCREWRQRIGFGPSRLFSVAPKKDLNSSGDKHYRNLSVCCVRKYLGMTY